MNSWNHKSVGESGSPRNIIDYLRHRSKDEVSYYAEGHEPMRWLGSGATDLGLHGAVDDEVFCDLLVGKLPDDSETGIKRGSKYRYGTDWTLSAPKSFSLLALGGDERLLTAWDEAVAYGVGLLEEEVAGTRRGKAGAERIEGARLIAAAARHEDARPVNGHVDPDLHTHVFAVNAALGEDGKWRAVDYQIGGGAARVKMIDRAVKGRLAERCRELGYETRSTKDGFEIVGVSRHQIEATSGRNKLINEAYKAAGVTRETAGTGMRTQVGVRTREGKTDVTQDELRWQWRADMRALGLDPDHLRQQAEARGPIEESQEEKERLIAEAVNQAVAHIAERKTVFKRDELRLEAARWAGDHADLEMLDAYIATEEAGLISVGDEYTTHAALERERHILTTVESGKGKAQALMTDEKAARVIAKRNAESLKNKCYELTQGQNAALALGLTSSDRYISIHGSAGVGKTTSAILGITEEAQAQGYEVIGLAPTTRARTELSGAAPDRVETIARFLGGESQLGGEKRLYIIDEAGMVGASDFEAILKRIEAEGARAVFVGDSLQLQAVAAGAPFCQIVKEKAAETAYIDEIIRQRNEKIKQASQLFARGQSSKAIEAAMSFVHEIGGSDDDSDDVKKRLAQAVADHYLALPEDEREETMLLVGTNDVRRGINEKIRESLASRGKIDDENAIDIEAADDARLTVAERKRSLAYQAGQIIEVREKGADKRWKTQRYRVHEVNEKTLEVSDENGEISTWDPRANGKDALVLNPRNMRLASGDKIIFRAAIKSGEVTIDNGTSATIISVNDKNIQVELEAGQRIEIDSSSPLKIDYGWARTIHSSQGATIKRAIVAGDGTKTANLAYVGISRAVENLEIITTKASKLKVAWQKWADTRSAKDLIAADAARQKAEEAREVALGDERRKISEAVINEHDHKQDHAHGFDEALELALSLQK